MSFGSFKTTNKFNNSVVNMADKELKSLLKEARENLKNKEFKAALKCCKGALKIDRDNYMAWVLVGAASQESGDINQALQALNKAASISPEQPLAWQGIITLFEKNPLSLEDFVTQLLPAYRYLIESTTDPLKQFDLVIALLSKIDSESCCAVFRDSIVPLLKQDEEKLRDILIRFLNVSKKCNSFDCTLFGYEELLSRGLSEAFASEYFEFLERNLTKEQLFAKYEDTSAKYPDSIYPARFFCKAYIDENCEKFRPEPMSENLILFADRLESVNEMELCNQARALHEFSLNHLKECIDFIKNIEVKKVAFRVLLLRCYVLTSQWRQSSEVLNYLSGIPENLQPIVLLCKAKLFMSQFRFVDANRFIEELKRGSLEPDVEFEIIHIQFDLFLEMKEFDRAFETVEKMKSLADADDACSLKRVCSSLCEIELDIERDLIDESIKSLGKLLERHTDCAEAFYLLGVALWKKDKFIEAVELFSKSVLLNPNDYRNFFWLGDYYRDRENNKIKASKCYQRSFTLNPHCQSVAQKLSNCLIDTGRLEANETFLRTAVLQTTSDRCRWAWLRIGLIELQKQDAANAIKSIQTAVRVDPNDVLGWESLGEAYYLNGSYSSALQSFNKCIEIDPSNYFYFYQKGLAAKAIKKFQDAIECFKLSLERQPNHLPTLLALGESHFLMARELVESSCFETAIQEYEQALNWASQSLSVRTDLVSLWKLAADILLDVAVIGFENVTFILPQNFQKLLRLDNQSDVTRSFNLLLVAERAYLRALAQRDSSASLWNDLGTVYLQLQFKGSPLEYEDGAFLKRSQSCLKRALTRDSKQSLFWNTYGVIAFYSKDYSLAQHCFIRAIQERHEWASPWSNLGILYLIHGNNNLANQVFGKAQSLEPEAHAAWSGQAIIAERIMHHEAMHLFQYVLEEVRLHNTAAMGFARWCVAALIKREVLTELHTEIALAGLRSCLKFKKSYCLYIMYGLLNEHLKFYSDAAQAFEAAFSLADKVEKKDLACLHLARVYLKSQDYGLVLSWYEKISNKSSAVLGLKLFALFALGICQDHSEISNLSSAIKSEFVALNDGLKILLEKSLEFSLSPDALVTSEAKAIHCCCNILLCKDVCLPSNADSLDPEQVQLLVLHKLLRNDLGGAQEVISSHVQNKSDDCNLLEYYASFLFLTRKFEERSASSLLDVAKKARLASDSILAKKLEVIAYVQAGSSDTAIKLCQELVHVVPFDSEARILLQWCMLATDKRLKVKPLIQQDEREVWARFLALLHVQTYILQGSWKNASDVVGSVPVITTPFAFDDYFQYAPTLALIQEVSSKLANSSDFASLKTISDPWEPDDRILELSARIARLSCDPERLKITLDSTDENSKAFLFIVTEYALWHLENNNFTECQEALERAAAVNKESIVIRFLQGVLAVKECKLSKSDLKRSLYRVFNAAGTTSWMTDLSYTSYCCLKTEDN